MPQPIVMPRRREPSAWEKMAPYVMGILQQQLGFGHQKKMLEAQQSFTKEQTGEGQAFQKEMQTDTQTFQKEQDESFRTWKEGILKGEKEWDLKLADIKNGQDLIKQGWSMLGPDESAGKFDVTIGDRVFSPPTPEIVKMGQHSMLKMGQQYQILKPRQTFAAIGGGAYLDLNTDKEGNLVPGKIHRVDPALTGDLGNAKRILYGDRDIKTLTKVEKDKIFEKVGELKKAGRMSLYGSPAEQAKDKELAKPGAKLKGQYLGGKLLDLVRKDFGTEQKNQIEGQLLFGTPEDKEKAAAQLLKRADEKIRAIPEWKDVKYDEAKGGWDVAEGKFIPWSLAKEGQKGKPAQFKTAADVKKSYRAGEINKDEAMKILREQFGMD